MPEDVISFVLPATLIGLIGLVVGVVAGYVLAGLFAPPEAAEPQRPKNLIEAARLWRDKRSGKWIIEVDGQLVSDPNNLTIRQRDTLQKAQDELRQWVGETPLPERAAAPSIPPTARVEPPAPRPPSGPLASRIRPPSGELPAAPAPARPPSGPLASRIRPPSGELPLPVGPAPAVEPVSTDLSTMLAKPIFGEKKEAAPLKSIAGQVDDILQERLPDSPYRDRVVKLQDSPHMGIQVVVDGHVFEGVGDVPYPDIQQFIRECVAEWEHRSAK